MENTYPNNSVATDKRCECGEKLVGHEDESSTKCRWCVTGYVLETKSAPASFGKP